MDSSKTFPLNQIPDLNSTSVILIPKKHGTIIIDYDDYEKLIKNKWSLSVRKTKNKHSIYFLAYGSKQISPGSKKNIKQPIARIILGITNSEIFVDHINRNSLDNRKVNLRLCSKAQNSMNRGKSRPSSSKFKGVYFDKQRIDLGLKLFLNAKKFI